MIRCLLALALILSTSISWGQAAIRGKMTDAQTGETLIGANVVIKSPYMGAMADLDGNFILDGLAPGTYEVVGSFIGYTPITETVTVDNDVVLLDFNLYIETYVIEQAAEVVAKVDRSRDVYMENIKKKSAASMDFISSQQIKQAGDSDAAGAIKRVPGVSTVGNFVFVRGLSDRYIKTTLNGAEVPSMNPRRNSIEMDLFPHQPCGQPGHHEDPNRQPPGRLGRCLHQRGNEGLPRAIHAQLQLHGRRERPNHIPNSSWVQPRQHRLARIRRWQPRIAQRGGRLDL